MPAPKTISGHLSNLLRQDISVALDCAQWLAPTQRELDRRSRPRRLANRFVAAQILIKAFTGDVAACREVMDRTEGKVADIQISGSFDDLIKSLEMGRQRLLAPIAEPQVSIEGEIINPHLVVTSEHQVPEEPGPTPDPTESTPSK